MTGTASGTTRLPQPTHPVEHVVYFQALSRWLPLGGLLELVVEQVLGDGRVPACGGVRQVEDQGQVQRVRSGGQRLVQNAVAANAVEVDTVALQMKLEIALADGLDPEGGRLGDQYVPVGGVRPGVAALVEPGSEGTVGQLAEPLGVAGDGDAPVGQVQVVQHELPECGGAAAWAAARARISRCAGLPATWSTARISASVMGSRVRSTSAALRSVVGLVKTRPRFLA